MRHNFTLFLIISLFVVSCTPRSYLFNEGYFSAVDSEKSNTQPKIEPSQKEVKKEVQEEPNNDVIPQENTTKKTSSASNAKLEKEHISITTLNPFADAESDEVEIYLEDLVEDFAYPIYGSFSSPYGKRNSSFHSGIDITAPAESPIYAAFSGTVRFSKKYGDYGNTIVIQHDSGLETAYAHCSKLFVRVGDDVECGEEIARCGKSGNATGYHLHFEVRANGKAINPELIINKDTEGLQSGVLILTQDSKGNVIAELADENGMKASKNNAINVSNPKSKGMMIDGKVYNAPAPAPKPQEPEKIYHTVVRGDTLSQIAEKYDQGLSVVLKLNNMTRNSVIKVGQKLRIK